MRERVSKWCVGNYFIASNQAIEYNERAHP